MTTISETRYHCDNALLTPTATEPFGGNPIKVAPMVVALGVTQRPCRFELIGSNPTVVLFSGHNPAAAVALRRAVQEAFPEARPMILLCGSLTGRDPARFLDQVGIDSAELLVATEPVSPRALPAQVLADAARAIGVPAITLPDPDQALAVAIAAAGPEGLVIATGSLNLVDVLRKSASEKIPVAAATR